LKLTYAPVERLAISQPIGASHEVDRLGGSLYRIVPRRRACVARSELVVGEGTRMYRRVCCVFVGSSVDDVRYWVVTSGVIALDRSHEIWHQTSSQNWTKDMHLAVHKDVRRRVPRQRSDIRLGVNENESATS
jgi:hypothetical protein